MDSVGRLFEESAPKLLRYLRSLGTSVDEAEEARSYAFEELIRAVHSGNPPHTNPESFVFTVAKRRLYAQWNQNSREAPLDDSVEELADEARDPLITKLERTLATRAFLAMEPESRALLWRVLGEGISQHDLAHELGLSSAAVRKRVSRYRQELREHYLAAYASGVATSACEPMLDLLARRVSGTDTPRQRARLEAHLAECDRCSRVLRDLGDEAAVVRRAYGILPWALIAGVSYGTLLDQQPTSAAAAPGPAASGGGAVGASAPAAGVAAGATASAGSGLRWRSDHTGGRLARVMAGGGALLTGAVMVVALVLLGQGLGVIDGGGTEGAGESAPGAQPQRVEMPAPGESVDWPVEIANRSGFAAVEAEIEVHADLSASDDTAFLSLRAGQKLLLDELPLDALPAGAGQPEPLRYRLPPGASAQLQATVSRPANGRDDSLTGAVWIGTTDVRPQGVFGAWGELAPPVRVALTAAAAAGVSLLASAAGVSVAGGRRRG